MPRSPRARASWRKRPPHSLEGVVIIGLGPEPGLALMLRLVSLGAGGREGGSEIVRFVSVSVLAECFVEMPEATELVAGCWASGDETIPGAGCSVNSSGDTSFATGAGFSATTGAGISSASEEGRGTGHEAK